jgi:hypothetical protein
VCSQFQHTLIQALPALKFESMTENLYRHDDDGDGEGEGEEVIRK